MLPSLVALTVSIRMSPVHASFRCRFRGMTVDSWRWYSPTSHAAKLDPRSQPLRASGSAENSLICGAGGLQRVTVCSGVQRCAAHAPQVGSVLGHEGPRSLCALLRRRGQLRISCLECLSDEMELCLPSHTTLNRLSEPVDAGRLDHSSRSWQRRRHQHLRGGEPRWHWNLRSGAAFILGLPGRSHGTIRELLCATMTIKGSSSDHAW